MRLYLFFIATFSVLSLIKTEAQTPPYSGTIFIDPDIITSSDSSSIQSTTYAGRGQRQVYDRRVNNWVNINAYLFDVTWNDGVFSEAVVNPEFGTIELAKVEAEKYARLIGQLPFCLRLDVDQIWIHQGVQPFGGGNRSILIHTGQSAIYEASGIIEETLVHEAAHTSLDFSHGASSGWITAQNKDVNFISTYARDNPTREDIAESFLPWLMVKYKSSKISTADFNKITQTIPNRLAYFDSQAFNLYPFFGNKTSTPPPLFTGGTNFLYPDIITPSDPSSIQSTTYAGRGQRQVYDRRVNNWININAYLFNVVWDDGITSEAVVNPEFGTIDSARFEAEKYARIIGQLPNCLRIDVDQIWINKGVQVFGGGNKAILIHTGQSAIYEAAGFLEETFVHEATHTSLDFSHGASTGWKTAQSKDGIFISTYSRDFPDREDIAESFLVWLMARYRPSKITATDFNRINQAISSRLAYFDSQSFNLYPFVGNIVSTSSLEDIKPIVYVYPNPFTEVLNIEVQLEKPNALEVEIIDALGRVLRVAKSSNVTDKHALQIQNLDYTGILFVKVKSEGKYALVKVVKNN
ncbi:MAG: T9SS type A sorting domain-containing protein [Haliscomenobacter sp.]|nr:T9SS type A sorting domain-containing protein [Haliscomenobacter sp.]